MGSDGKRSTDQSLCSKVGVTRPSATQSCTMEPCLTYAWSKGQWGACSVTCGTGTATRQVVCMGSNGKVKGWDGRVWPVQYDGLAHAFLGSPISICFMRAILYKRSCEKQKKPCLFFPTAFRQTRSIMNRLVVTDICARCAMLCRFSISVRVGPARRGTQQKNILATRTCIFPSRIFCKGKPRACFSFTTNRNEPWKTLCSLRCCEGRTGMGVSGKLATKNSTDPISAS